jgi:hypothetical protein
VAHHQPDQRARRRTERRPHAELARPRRNCEREGLTVGQAATRLRESFPGVPEVEHLARFAETSVRGLTR